MMDSPHTSRPQDLLPLRPLEFSILLVLSRDEQYGYALAKMLAEDEHGSIRLAPGNLYQVLDRMIRAGLVREAARRPAAGARNERRRYYAITELGLDVASLEADRIRAMRPAMDSLTEPSVTGGGR